MIKMKTTDTMPLSVRQSSRYLYMYFKVIASIFLPMPHVVQWRPAAHVQTMLGRLMPQTNPQFKPIPAFSVDEPQKIVHYLASHFSGTF
ncbi:MAG: hypothetical protein IPQ16_09570 [Geobacteraceae bacterium]|nr:hypothetical protein [Geobacteraceae bacterium]